MGQNGLTLNDTSATFNQDMAGSLCWMTSGKNAGLAREIAGASAAGSYPTLQVADGTHVATTKTGMTKSIAISNVTELQAMNDDLTGNYYLSGNIDASATSTWNGGKGFKSIGTIGASNLAFRGTLDGCGYTITGIYQNDTAKEYRGFFGELNTETDATDIVIANLTLKDCAIFTIGPLIKWTQKK